MTRPNIAFIPNAYKTGKTYSVLPTDGNSDFEFTRNSTGGSRVNKEGILEEMGVDVPRVNYLNNRRREFRNKIGFSEEFTSGWSVTASGTGVTPTITYNQPDPFGGTNAVRIVFNRGAGTSTSDQSYIQQILSANIGQGLASMYVKTYDGTEQTMYLRSYSTIDAAVAKTVNGEWSRIIDSRVLVDRVSFGNRAGYAWSGSNQIVDILVYGIQLEKGTKVTDYEIKKGSNVQRHYWQYNLTDRPSLQIERACVNYVREHVPFDVAFQWNKNGTPLMVENYGVSPDGTKTAIRVKNNLGGTGIYYTTLSNNTGAADYIEMSMFFKHLGGSGRIKFYADGTAYTAPTFCIFDIENGVVCSEIADSYATIMPYPNGWYRCSVIRRANAIGTMRVISYQDLDLDTDYMCWGGQISIVYPQFTAYLGEWIPQSFIFNRTLADLTRQVEIYRMPNLADYVTDYPLTVYCEYVINDYVSGVNPFSIYANSGAYLTVEMESKTLFRVVRRDGVDNDTDTQVIDDTSYDQKIKVAINFVSNTYYKTYVNGVQIPDQVGSYLDVDFLATEILLGMRRTSSDALFRQSNIYDFRLWDKSLTHDELVGLTTI